MGPETGCAAGRGWAPGPARGHTHPCDTRRSGHAGRGQATRSPVRVLEQPEPGDFTFVARPPSRGGGRTAGPCCPWAAGAGGRLAELAAWSRLPTAAREAATATCRDGSASTRRADGGPGRAGLTLTLPGSQVPGPGHVGLWGATCWPRTSGDGEPAWRTLGSMRHVPSDCRPCARGACSGLWLSRRLCWEKVPHRGR